MDWFKKWMNLQNKFVSQPYSLVRNVLAAGGDESTAATVGYAGRDRELVESAKNGDLLNVVYLFVSKIMIGYGYQMWLPIIWTTFFVTLGAMLFRRSSDARRERMRSESVLYGLDMFLPLLQFRRRHFEIDLKSRVRYYFYLHRIAGWIIGSFIIAGLAGFTK